MVRANRWLQDISASVADLGVMIPIAAALVVGNGLDAGTVLVGAGAFYLVAGVYFRVPIPVQPIKAAAAIAIARDLPAETIGAAGVILGAIVLLLGVTGASGVIARAFATPLVRGLQLGVGLILMRAAFEMVASSASDVVLTLAIAIALIWGARRATTLPLALSFCIAGIVVSVAGGIAFPHLGIDLWQPATDVTAAPSVWLSALVLLVIPQIPLTLGNAVVAVVDLEHRYFPVEARKVTPERVSISCGVANIITGGLGGMPMCHGSGGLTAHHRAGARSFRMNLFIGGILLVLGLLFGSSALGLLLLIPGAVLAGLLSFTGFFHAGLVGSERGFDLLVALVVGLLGAITANLAIGLAAGAVLYWPRTLLTGHTAEAPAPG